MAGRDGLRVVVVVALGLLAATGPARASDVPVERTAATRIGTVDPPLTARRTPTVRRAAALTRSFAGLAQGAAFTNLAPPDVTMDVGLDYAVEAVNSGLAVFDKRGFLLGSGALATIFSLGPGAATCGGGLPVHPTVRYDELAGRWLVAALERSGPGAVICVALSETADPLGAYTLWELANPTGNDAALPNWGVTASGYYLSYRDLPTIGASRPVVMAWDRPAMLGSAPAPTVEWLALAGVDALTPAPADVDGTAGPTTGNVFVAVDDAANAIRSWSFVPSFAIGAPGSVSQLALAPVAPFESGFSCAFAVGGSTQNCVSQPDPTAGLAVSADRVMGRVSMRQLAGRTSLVLNHTVDHDGANDPGVRWYELTGNLLTAPTLRQQGTIASSPDDRWMGSAAVDANGGVTVGYSISSPSRNPSLAASTRLNGDPLGTMAQGEQIIHAGASPYRFAVGSTVRWGDTSALAVDPLDGCTVWQAGEYATAPTVWATRIAAFRPQGCTTPPSDLHVTGSSTITPDPLKPRVRVEFAVANAGPARAGSVVFAGTFPLVIASLSSLTADRGAGCAVDTASGLFSCDLGGLDPGQTGRVAITLVAEVAAVAEHELAVTGLAEAFSPDSSPDDNTATVAALVGPGYAVSALAGPQPVVGGLATITLRLTNTGNSGEIDGPLLLMDADILNAAGGPVRRRAATIEGFPADRCQFVRTLSIGCLLQGSQVPLPGGSSDVPLKVRLNEPGPFRVRVTFLGSGSSAKSATFTMSARAARLRLTMRARATGRERLVTVRVSNPNAARVRGETVTVRLPRGSCYVERRGDEQVVPVGRCGRGRTQLVRWYPSEIGPRRARAATFVITPPTRSGRATATAKGPFVATTAGVPIRGR